VTIVRLSALEMRPQRGPRPRPGRVVSVLGRYLSRKGAARSAAQLRLL